MFHMFYKELKINMFLSSIIYIFGLLGLLLSGSITAFVIYIFTTLIYFFLYKKIGIKFILGASFLIIILASTFTEEIERTVKRQKLTSDNFIPSSLMYRINERWLMVYNDFEEHYIIGIGPAAVELTYATDNEYLDRFLRYGLLGGMVFLIFIILLIIYPLIQRKKTNDRFIRKLFLFSSLLAITFALASMTGTAFKAKRVSELFWIFYSLPFINTYLSNYRLNNDKH
jgi:O-antigen ligase